MNLLQVLLVGDRAVLIAELREELWPLTENATCLVALLHYGVVRSLLQWISLVLVVQKEALTLF